MASKEIPFQMSLGKKVTADHLTVKDRADIGLHPLFLCPPSLRGLLLQMLSKMTARSFKSPLSLQELFSLHPYTSGKEEL